MTDTVRTIAALQTLLADGQPAGSITPQIVRDMLVSLDPLNANVAFSRLTSKPTTIAGWGITDYNSLGDARWVKLAGSVMTGALGLTDQAAPSAPASGALALYTRQRNTVQRPFWMDSDGNEFAFQPSMIDRRLVTQVASGTTGWQGTGGVMSVTSGTGSASTLATTNKVTVVRRTLFTSGTSANSYACASQLQMMYPGRASGAPCGFEGVIVFGHDTDLASSRLFAGLVDVNNTALTGDPGSHSAAKFGVGLDAADTNYQLMNNVTSAAVTKTDLGVARGSGTYFVLYLRSKPGVVGFSWALYDGLTGSVIGTPATITSNIPASSLGVNVTVNNGASGASAVVASLTRYAFLTDN